MVFENEFEGLGYLIDTDIDGAEHPLSNAFAT